MHLITKALLSQNAKNFQTLLKALKDKIHKCNQRLQV